MQIAVGIVNETSGDYFKTWRDALSGSYATIHDRFRIVKEPTLRVYDTDTKQLYDRTFEGLKTLTNYSEVDPFNIDDVTDSFKQNLDRIKETVPLARAPFCIENAVQFNGENDAVCAWRSGKEAGFTDYTELVVQPGQQIADNSLTKVHTRSKHICPIYLHKSGSNYSIKAVDILTGEESLLNNVNDCIENEVASIWKALMTGMSITGLSFRQSSNIHYNYVTTVSDKNEVELYQYTYLHPYNQKAIAEPKGEALVFDADNNRFIYYCLISINGKIQLCAGEHRNWHQFVKVGADWKDGVLHPVKVLDGGKILVADLNSKKRSCGSIVDARIWNLDYWDGRAPLMLDGYYDKKAIVCESASDDSLLANMALELFMGKPTNLSLDSKGDILACELSGNIADLRGAQGIKSRIIPAPDKFGHMWIVLDGSMKNVCAENPMASLMNNLTLLADGIEPTALVGFINSVKGQVRMLRLLINITRYDLKQVGELLSDLVVNNVVDEVSVYRAERLIVEPFSVSVYYKGTTASLSGSNGSYDKNMPSIQFNGSSSALKKANRLFNTSELMLRSFDMELAVLSMTYQLIQKLRVNNTLTVVKCKEVDYSESLVVVSKEDLLFSSLSQKACLFLSNGKFITIGYPRVKTSFYTVFKLFQALFKLYSGKNDDAISDSIRDLRVAQRKVIRELYLAYTTSLRAIGMQLADNENFQDGTVILKIKCSDTLRLNAELDTEINKQMKHLEQLFKST